VRIAEEEDLMRSRSLVCGSFVVSLLLAAAIARAADPAPSGAAPAAKEGTKMEQTGKNPIVVISTSMGNIEAELYADKAPESVKNFLAYAESGHYNDTVFHRVIKGFMIQGGGMTADMNQKPTKAPIKNEADNGLKNANGTLAMARTSVVDSATSQFFINVKDNAFLDHKGKTPQGYGYAVFGKVISGTDVVQKIENVATSNKGMHQDVPSEPVVIKSITVKK
jgi:peptidyl-prolyl cis-trans isomerase B (cyclophilin B)